MFPAKRRWSLPSGFIEYRAHAPSRLLAKRIRADEDEAEAAVSVRVANPEVKTASEAATKGSSHARRFGTPGI
jgi:hypothetical protein